jgi:hypothetical protein
MADKRIKALKKSGAYQDLLAAKGFTDADVGRELAPMAVGLLFNTSTRKIVSVTPNGVASLQPLDNRTIRTVSAATGEIIASTDRFILADDSSNVIALGLPAAALNAGLLVTIKALTGTNDITVDGNASETIDGATTFVMTADNEVLTLLCDGTSWHIMNNYL